jgi:hypothetical protein
MDVVHSNTQGEGIAKLVERSLMLLRRQAHHRRQIEIGSQLWLQRSSEWKSERQSLSQLLTDLHKMAEKQATEYAEPFAYIPLSGKSTMGQYWGTQGRRPWKKELYVVHEV